MRDESVSDVFAPFPPAKFDANRMQAEAHDRRVAYTRKIESGLRSNLLVALQLIIEDDPEIPSPHAVHDLAVQRRNAYLASKINH